MKTEQHTIKEKAGISGIGLHTGEKCNLTFLPAQVNHGIKFQRVDLKGQPFIDVSVDNVVDVSRGTTLGQNGVRVNTVEHALAAAYALQIDNMVIQVDGPETPILDGCSRRFMDVLMGAGIINQGVPRKFLAIQEPLSFVNRKTGVEMRIMPHNDFSITVMVDFDSIPQGSQHFSMWSLDEFYSEVSRARTFCFVDEILELHSKNLVKGGDLSNSVVLINKEITDEEKELLLQRYSNAPEDVFEKKEGILNEGTLYYDNELARHKLLDVVGDLALLNRPILGNVVAYRPGHAANVALAKKIKGVAGGAPLEETSRFDPDKSSTIFNAVQIAEMLPHRYPFLLVDRVIELTDKNIVAIKNLTYNEPFFRGHFPGNPVMPGVLMIEAFNQVGGVLVLSATSQPGGYWTYFLGINYFKFYRLVFPGDTLVVKLELVSEVRHGYVDIRGAGYVGSKQVFEGAANAVILKKR